MAVDRLSMLESKPKPLVHGGALLLLWRHPCLASQPAISWSLHTLVPDFLCGTYPLHATSTSFLVWLVNAQYRQTWSDLNFMEAAGFSKSQQPFALASASNISKRNFEYKNTWETGLG